MTNAISSVGAGTTPDARLREAARSLEGVFVSQLYQAMRRTVPDGGMLDSGVGGDLFTQMFDEQMAETFAQGLTGSIGDRLYEQLRGVLMATAAETEGRDSDG